MNHKSLDVKKISTDGLDISQVAILYSEFFTTQDYSWWYEVLPDDVVVDIGACAGFFSALALDKGAERVYMVEPNKKLLKTAIQNVSDYIIEDNQKVVPVWGAVSEMPRDYRWVIDNETDDSEFPKFSFKEFIDKYEIDQIDFLKIDCEGAEYSICKEEMIPFFENNVRHIALEVHLRAVESSPKDFIEFRDRFLSHFIKKGKVRYKHNFLSQTINNDWAILNKDYSKVPAEIMIYITNW